jgi:hypothetical protein
MGYWPPVFNSASTTGLPISFPHYYASSLPSEPKDPNEIELDKKAQHYLDEKRRLTNIQKERKLSWYRTFGLFITIGLPHVSYISTLIFLGPIFASIFPKDLEALGWFLMVGVLLFRFHGFAELMERINLSNISIKK